MLFPKLMQRTDFSKHIHRFSSEFEQAYIKQITMHFIESFRNIQAEIDAIVTQRPECIALLTGQQQSELHNKQAKSNARFLQMSASAKPSSAASLRHAACTNDNNATPSMNAASTNGGIAMCSNIATSINDNAAMDTTAEVAQPGHPANKPAPWPPEPRVQQRPRSRSNRQHSYNQHAPLRNYTQQTNERIYNRQFWNSNYYNNNRQRQPRAQPWTHYSQRRTQYGPFRRPNYQNGYNSRGGGYYHYNSDRRNYNYRPPWPNHYEQQQFSNRQHYDPVGIYEAEHCRTGTGWQPYGNYQSYGGYTY
jgi:hypothetical protein